MPHDALQNAETFFKNISQQNSESDELRVPVVNLKSMNEDQRFVYGLVMDTLLKHKQGLPVKPLRLIVTGQAGAGKTYLINALVHSIRTLYKKNKSVQVLGPTGTSANLLFEGKTIHNFLKIPTGKKCAKDMSNPSGQTALTLQDNCDGLMCLITDELSLVGCNTLGWMEFHCQFGLKNTHDWGGIPVVIMTGDNVQLPPVCDSPPYHCKSSKSAAIRGYSIWKLFTSVVNLQQVMRQDSHEVHLKDTLQRLRTYSATQEDVRWLQTFQWDQLKRKYGYDSMNHMADNALFIFPTHKEEWEHNKNQLLKLNSDPLRPIAEIKADLQGIHSKSASADNSQGLIRLLYVCKGARVMLTNNINVDYGLYNGAVGTVVDIIYPEGKSPVDQVFPQFILVEFPRYTGPSWIEGNPKLIPVTAIQRRLDCNCCFRTQVPLRPGFGTTCHRVQGMTIGPGNLNRYIVINPGSKTFEARNPGILYVSLSRAKSAGSATALPDFAFNPDFLLDDERVTSKPRSPLIKAREAEIVRLQHLAVKTRQEFPQLCTTAAFEEILHKIHADDFGLEE